MRFQLDSGLRGTLLLLIGGTLALGSCTDDPALEPVGPTPVLPAISAVFSLTAAGTATPIINEVMIDPVAVADGRGEWFEVHNPGAGSVDLQGWQLTSRGNGVHVIAGPLVVPAVVLGRNAAQSKNGGGAVNYSYGNSIGFL